MATITTSVDPVYNRVGVTLSAFSADGAITVERVLVSTGARAPMRAVSAVSGGSAFGWDYEAPFGVPVRYEAYDGATLIASSDATVPGVEAWLRSPGLPVLDLAIELLDVPPTKRERPRVVLRPFGRASALVLSDTAKSAEFQLVVRTYGYTQADQLVELFSQTPTALLLMPGGREPYRYVSLGNLVEAPLVKYRAADGSDVDDPGGIFEWSLDCVVTDAPTGGLYGDPTSSYATVAATFATYSTLLAAKPSYLELLKGV